MPFYKYRAKGIDGKVVKGEVEAPDSHILYQMMKEQNLFVISSKEIVKTPERVTIRPKELVDFTQQLGTMLSSGISLTRTLHIIVQRTNKERLKKVYARLHELVLQGVLLSDAMEQQGTAFPYLMINMIRAGEASGQMEKVAIKLSLHYEKDSKLQSKIKSALIYPLIILCMTIAVVILIFTLILPKLFKVFEENEDLPAMTKVMMNFSHFITENWIMAVLLFGIIVIALIMINKTSKVTAFRQRAYLKLPILKGIMSTIYTARFARGLSSLYSSGLSMVQSLQICQGLLNNRYIEKQFPEAVTNVKNGVALSTVMMNMSGFDTKLAASIYVGEESGKINEILDRLADNYDYEAEQATGRLVTFIEPIMIILMAVVVGAVMLSVLVPIYQYYQGLGA